MELLDIGVSAKSILIGILRYPYQITLNTLVKMAQMIQCSRSVKTNSYYLTRCHIRD